MARSKKLKTIINYPYEDIMVVERWYEFVKDHKENRPNDKPLKEKEGWVGYITQWRKMKTSNGEVQVCREVYAKKAQLFTEVAKAKLEGKRVKGRPKRHIRVSE